MTQDSGARQDHAPPSMLAGCDVCGDVVINVELTRVSRNWAPGQGWYAFDCPRCVRCMRVPADASLLNVLVCLGAQPATRPRHLRLVPPAPGA